MFNYSADNKIIGIRHGEKTYETLLTDEECFKAIDLGNFYRVPCDKRDLNYDKYIDSGSERSGLSQFNSNNTQLLSVEETMEKLLTIKEIRDEIENWKASH